MLTEPQISVLMTVYNAESFLREAIESILAQSFEDFEFIVVDDASTDRSQEIIRSYMDPRIVYLYNEKNAGQTKSLNRGIKISRGRYIARMDADDIAYPKRLQVQYEFLEQNPDIAVVGSWSEDIDENGRVLRKVRPPTDPLEIKCLMAGSGDLSYWCISHPTVLMRREALERLGFYREEGTVAQGYPQDYELWSRLLRENNFANIGQILLQYRILGQSDSRHFWQEQVGIREEITLSQIRYYLPNIDTNEARILLKMLEYQKQDSADDAKRVFHVFDRYMRVFLGDRYSSPVAQKIIHRMKLYYIPRLFINNKLRSFHEIGRIWRRYPVFVFDAKFYRKSLRVFFESVLPSDQYRKLFKRILIYR